MNSEEILWYYFPSSTEGAVSWYVFAGKVLKQCSTIVSYVRCPGVSYVWWHMSDMLGNSELLH